MARGYNVGDSRDQWLQDEMRRQAQRLRPGQWGQHDWRQQPYYQQPYYQQYYQQQPYYQQPYYQQPYYQQPYYQQPYGQSYQQGGYRWVPAFGTFPGHWVRA